MATVVDSVEVVPGRLANADDLDARLEALRALHPRSTIERYLGALPSFGRRVLVAAGAAIIGDVRIGDEASIWYGCVLRGDIARIDVGRASNIQDGSVLHVADNGPCVIGNEVVVGHRVVLHACCIGDACLIGMQATVLDDAVVGCGSIVGAGAVVTAKTVIPPRSLVLGCPARVIRSLGEDVEASHRKLAQKYVRLKENYLRDALAKAAR